jgi:predicted RecB family nuclease
MKTMSNLKDAKRGSFYFIDKKPFASVTTILSVIDKPALRRWYGEQVYYAMLNNPSLKKEDALSAPFAMSQTAKSRGTTVHSMVEAYKAGTVVEEAHIPEQFKGYAKAFYTWIEHHHIDILEHEKTVICKEYQYAGTMDLLVKLNGTTSPTVVDVKTGKDIYTEAFMQISAYQYALKEGGTESGSIAVLLLKDDGTYKFEVMSDFARKFQGFLACQKMYEALNEEMLKKIGYFEGR